MPRNTQPRTPRVHRLPKRLDYILIPAPSDLSLDTVCEKSPLPAIIVTPSSPSSNKDFSIAFLAPPQKPSFCDRIAAYFGKNKGADQRAEGHETFHFMSFFKWDSQPISLPTSTPPSPTSPDVNLTPYSSGYHQNTPVPLHSRLMSRLLILTFVVMTLLLCHMTLHYIALVASMPSPDQLDTMDASSDTLHVDIEDYWLISMARMFHRWVPDNQAPNGAAMD
jgi:hypothetical protein